MGSADQFVQELHGRGRMSQGSQPGGVQRCNQDAGRNSHRFTNVIVFQLGLVLIFAEISHRR